MDYKSKSEKKRVETIKETKKELSYRLYCEACTGIAGYYSENESIQSMVVCHNCGKQTVVKKQNFIPLTKEEKQRLKE